MDCVVILILNHYANKHNRLWLAAVDARRDAVAKVDNFGERKLMGDNLEHEMEKKRLRDEVAKAQRDASIEIKVGARSVCFVRVPSAFGVSFGMMFSRTRLFSVS